MSALESLYGGQITLSTLVIKPNICLFIMLTGRDGREGRRGLAGPQGLPGLKGIAISSLQRGLRFNIVFHVVCFPLTNRNLLLLTF